MKKHYWARAVFNTIKLVLLCTFWCVIGIGAVISAGWLITILINSIGDWVSGFVDLESFFAAFSKWVGPVIVVGLFAVPFIWVLVMYCRQEHERLVKAGEQSESAD